MNEKMDNWGRAFLTDESATTQQRVASEKSKESLLFTKQNPNVPLIPS